MASKRVPLANNTNAINSPLRPTAAAKRARVAAADVENVYTPPKKKQLLDVDKNGARRAQLINQPAHPEPSIFDTRAPHTNNFQKRLVSARNEPKQHDERQPSKSKGVDPEVVKQWKRHYKKAFPTFVFYFESLAADVTLRAHRQIAALGAHQEKFFSKDITHIVTTRPVPSTASDSNLLHQSAVRQDPSTTNSNPSYRTINPSLLDRTADARSLAANKSRQQAEARKLNSQWNELESRRITSSNNDILYKAKEMGIKIWPLEKFERIMTSMFEDEHDDVAKLRKPPRATRDTDLQQLLRNEKINAQVDRSLWQDAVPLKGYYIYVHDMNEKVKPVLVREYKEPEFIEDGDWPMFKSVSSGRCPFVEEPPAGDKKRRHDKREAEEQGRQAQQARLQIKAAEVERPVTRSVTKSPQKAPLRELSANTVQAAKQPAPPTSKTFEPPKLKPGASSIDSMPPMLGSARGNFQGIARNHGGEPVASGMRGNVTSAIRSQIISSTAAGAPGQRAGTSKEVHQLSRRVLERHSGLSGNSAPSSYPNEARNTATHETKHNTRSKTGQPLARIQEEEAQGEGGRLGGRQQKVKKALKREAKPGYCENCRDKYDDFHEHVESRKHKKFANTNENWVELDELLRQLKRPLLVHG